MNELQEGDVRVVVLDEHNFQLQVYKKAFVTHSSKNKDPNRIEWQEAGYFGKLEWAFRKALKISTSVDSIISIKQMQRVHDQLVQSLSDKGIAALKEK